jgi:hypothetical protein
MLRAYLMTASVAAALIQLVVLVSIVAFGVREQYFQTPAFRVSTVSAVCVMVLMTNRIARAAFRFAVARRYANFDESISPGVRISQECPARPLVILHLKFARRPCDLTQS